MFLHLSVILLTGRGGVRGCSRCSGGGHAWLLCGGGACVARGGMRGRDTVGHCAGGTHPTGMHSCSVVILLTINRRLILIHFIVGNSVCETASYSSEDSMLQFGDGIETPSSACTWATNSLCHRWSYVLPPPVEPAAAPTERPRGRPGG